MQGVDKSHSSGIILSCHDILVTKKFWILPVMSAICMYFGGKKKKPSKVWRQVENHKMETGVLDEIKA